MSDNRLTQTEQSLNPVSEKRVKVKINGIQIEVPSGENIIEAAKRIGVEIPFFCYHPRLSKGDAANCRMCLVEVATTAPDGSVRKMPKPQAACTMPAAEGMVIETETPALVKDRKGVLELLLKLCVAACNDRMRMAGAIGHVLGFQLQDCIHVLLGLHVRALGCAGGSVWPHGVRSLQSYKKRSRQIIC